MYKFIKFIQASWDLLVNSWGLLAALIAYIGQSFIIPQILDFKKILKRARYDVIYYANVFPIQDNNLKTVNKNQLNSAQKELRVIAAKIKSYRDDIPLYSLISKFKLLPSLENTEKISTAFIGWSNELYSITPGDNGRQKRRKEIATALQMRHF